MARANWRSCSRRSGSSSRRSDCSLVVRENPDSLAEWQLPSAAGWFITRTKLLKFLPSRRLPLLLILFCLVPFALQALNEDESPPEKFAPVEAIVQEAIARGEIPGAVVLVGYEGKVAYKHAFGWRALDPKREPMTLDTIFDIASLTKVVATTPAIMRMVQLGQVRLNDPVAHYLPEFAANRKQDVTIRQLLTHFSGLPPDADLKTPWIGKQQGLQLVMNSELDSPPGSQFVYSDVNFIVLGALVERVTGQPLEQYAQANVFDPLKMEHTRFNPPREWLPKIAPTQYDEHEVMLHGVVHDPTARRMGGVAGHAGVFSTADDLARYAQALLDGDKILSPGVIEKMSTPQQPASSTVLRGLGWDIDSRFASNRGELLPVGSYGHTGFTGTSLWIDPFSKTYIIILTNAVHPRGKGTAVALRSKIATAVADILRLQPSDQSNAKLATITGYNETLAGARRLASRNGAVLSGIDVLEQQNFAPLLQGKANGNGPVRVGLLTNQTGMDAQGRRTIDVLAAAAGLQLTAIFSPEHGASGALETEAVANSVDPVTKIPIYSVYGTTDAQRRPKSENLENLDALVIDVQDAGARFYTYETTVGYFLEAAAKAGVRVFLLDRPNPITGSFVQGPMSEPGESSFVNHHPLPPRHGMTLGELAMMFNSERHINARLKVIAMQGWMRGDWYDSTNLPWINPSPNLRSLNQNTLYPGVALLEGTNVSVGRGADTPFELLGAPWINARELADYLNRRNVQNVRFVPVSFTPLTGPYANQVCHGVNLIVTDRNAFDAPELGIEIASALLKLYPADYKIDRMIELLANRQVFQAIVGGEDPNRIAEDWREQLEEFIKLRAKYLLYP